MKFMERDRSSQKKAKLEKALRPLRDDPRSQFDEMWRKVVVERPGVSDAVFWDQWSRDVYVDESWLARGHDKSTHPQSLSRSQSTRTTQKSKTKDVSGLSPPQPLAAPITPIPFNRSASWVSLYTNLDPLAPAGAHPPPPQLLVPLAASSSLGSHPATAVTFKPPPPPGPPPSKTSTSSISSPPIQSIHSQSIGSSSAEQLAKVGQSSFSHSLRSQFLALLNVSDVRSPCFVRCLFVTLGGFLLLFSFHLGS